MGRHNVSGMFSLPIMPSGMGKTCIISGVYIFPKNHILSLSPFQNDIFSPSKYCTDWGNFFFFLFFFFSFPFHHIFSQKNIPHPPMENIYPYIIDKLPRFIFIYILYIFMHAYYKIKLGIL